MKLSELGFDPKFSEEFARLGDPALEPARVAIEHRGAYEVWTASGPRTVTLRGRLAHEAVDRLDLPVVGDWVAIDPSGAAIVALLPRRGCLARQASGTRAEVQPIAANLDTVMVVTAPGDLNPRRLERYFAAIWDGGAAPVIVLNKADTADADALLATLGPLAVGVPALALSALTGAGVDALERWLAPGKTVALVGSSGVGKTTLLNRLTEGARATSTVREHDQRGRHTTTRRELVILAGGAILVDTPGMRELATWAADDGVADTFADVTAIAASCRFRDCSHDGEPGCAIAEAITSGDLDPARLGSMRKLERELAFQARRHDPVAQAAQRKLWKARTKSLRKHHGGGE